MTRRRSIPCLLVGFALSLAAIPAAYAQPATAPVRPKDGMDKADVYFREGNEHFKQQRWPEAETAYELALGLKKAHDIAANLGYAEARLGKLREAAEHLAFAVRTWPPTGKEDKRQFAVDRLALLKKELGTVTVQVNVARAEVFADGRFVGLSPLESEVFVDPGTRVIETKMFGYESARQAIRAERGSVHTVKLELLASPPTLPLSTASGGAATTGMDAMRSAGRQNGMSGGAGTPAVAEGGPNKALIVVGTATSVLAVGAGIAFAVVSTKRASDGDELEAKLRKVGPRPCLMPTLAADCDALESSREARDAFGDAAAWSFIAGGALAAGTLIYTFATPSGAQTAGMVALPIVTANGGALVVGGAW